MTNGRLDSEQNGDRHLPGDWEELLSAYVDGEVTPDERRLVESRLSNDPAARRLMDDFQAMSQTLRSLPTGPLPSASVPDTLLPAVMQHVSVAGVNGRGTNGPDANLLQPAATSGSILKRHPLRLLRKREWLAGTVAVVASVCVIALFPGQPKVGVGPELAVFATAERHEGAEDFQPFDQLAEVAVSPMNRRHRAELEKQSVPSAPPVATVAGSAVPAEPRAVPRAMDVADANSTAAKDEAAGSYQQRPGSPVAASTQAGARVRMPGMVPAAPSPVTAAVPDTLSLSSKSAGTGTSRVAGPLQKADVARADSMADSQTDLSRSPDAEALEPWAEVQPYLNLLSENTSAVANFDLVVLDVEKSASQLEVLLVQNGVLTVIDAPRPKSATGPARGATERIATEPATPQPVAANLPAPQNAAAAATSRSSIPAEAAASGISMLDLPVADLPVAGKRQQAPDHGELVAVYVEAEGEPITKALREMVRQRQVLAMKLQPPLEMGVGAAISEAAKPQSGVVPPQQNRADVDSELQLAYSNFRRQNMAGELAGDQAISAELSIGNRSQSSAVAETPAAKSGDLDHAVEALANPLGFAGTSGYQRRLKLPGAETNWLDDVQREQQSAATADDRAFQNHLRKSADPTTRSLRAMSTNLRQNAPGTVRVLFVLQPATVTAPAAAASEAPSQP